MLLYTCIYWPVFKKTKKLNYVHPKYKNNFFIKCNTYHNVFNKITRGNVLNFTLYKDKNSVIMLKKSSCVLCECT